MDSKGRRMGLLWVAIAQLNCLEQKVVNCCHHGKNHQGHHGQSDDWPCEIGPGRCRSISAVWAWRESTSRGELVGESWETSAALRFAVGVFWTRCLSLSAISPTTKPRSKKVREVGTVLTMARPSLIKEDWTAASQPLRSLPTPKNADEKATDDRPSSKQNSKLGQAPPGPQIAVASWRYIGSYAPGTSETVRLPGWHQPSLPLQAFSLLGKLSAKNKKDSYRWTSDRMDDGRYQNPRSLAKGPPCSTVLAAARRAAGTTATATSSSNAVHVYNPPMSAAGRALMFARNDSHKNIKRKRK